MTNKQSMQNLRKGVLFFLALIFLTKGVDPMGVLVMRVLVGIYLAVEVMMFFNKGN